MAILQRVRSQAGDALPLSVMAQSVGARVIAVFGVIVMLWLAVAWAVAQP